MSKTPQRFSLDHSRAFAVDSKTLGDFFQREITPPETEPKLDHFTMAIAKKQARKHFLKERDQLGLCDSLERVGRILPKTVFEVKLRRRALHRLTNEVLSMLARFVALALEVAKS